MWYCRNFGLPQTLSDPGFPEGQGQGAHSPFYAPPPPWVWQRDRALTGSAHYFC